MLVILSGIEVNNIFQQREQTEQFLKQSFDMYGTLLLPLSNFETIGFKIS